MRAQLPQVQGAFDATAAGLLLAVAMALAGCGPGAVGPVSVDSPRNALASTPEELDLTSFVVRARLFNELVRQSESQAREELTDGPAWFAVGREHQLVARALPFALFAGGPALVDVDHSEDPWPDEPRESLGGNSERQLAERAGATFVRLLGLPAEEPVLVERSPGAPFAAAWIDGRLRLNPALLYLAAGAEFPTHPWLPRLKPNPAPAPQQPAPVPAKGGCSSAPGALLPGASLAIVALLRRRSQRRPPPARRC